MLILLQPGIEPLGQFDLEDDDTTLVVGGEVGVFADLDEESDAYAGDVWAPGPRVQIELGDAAALGELHGLIDEGSSGYGTLFGTVIGGTVGQGTGFGTMSGTGTVVVGPSTVRGSGKATLWTKPGLYGVTVDAWASSVEFDALALNADVFGTAGTGVDRGKLTTSTAGVQVALGLGLTTDTSLVSTTNTAAGLQAATEYAALYLLGVQV
jgi:hypothetical protein